MIFLFLSELLIFIPLYIKYTKNIFKKATINSPTSNSIIRGPFGDDNHRISNLCDLDCLDINHSNNNNEEPSIISILLFQSQLPVQSI